MIRVIGRDKNLHQTEADLETGRYITSRIDLEQYRATCLRSSSTLQDFKRDANLLRHVVFRRQQPESSL